MTNANSNFTKGDNKMARLKRSSNILEAARQRLAGLKSITPAPDFGDGLSLTVYEAEINAFSTTIDSYNQELSSLDDKLNALSLAEENLREKNRRMLKATEAKYGPDSSEFEQAGGTRVSDRKRPTRKSKDPLSTTPRGSTSPTP
jgi:hypothetical protein